MFVILITGVAASVYKSQVLLARIVQESWNPTTVAGSIGKLGDLAADDQFNEDVSQTRHVCSLLERNPVELVHYANSRLLKEGVTGIRHPIEELTPFANLHRLCGYEILPLFKQAVLKHRMIRAAVRKLPTVISLASDERAVTIKDIATIDPYYLILGAVSKKAVSDLLGDILGVTRRPVAPFVFDPMNGLIDIDETQTRYVDHHIQRAMGRLISLSIIHSVAICDRFSDNLLSSLLGQTHLVDNGLMHLGFHDILPNDSGFELQAFITPSELGVILHGSFKKVSLNQVISATSTSLHRGPVMEWMWSFIKHHRDGPNAFVQLLTGSRCTPIGGIEVLAPPLQVLVEEYIPQHPMPRVDNDMNTLYLPSYPSYEVLYNCMDEFIQR